MREHFAEHDQRQWLRRQRQLFQRPVAMIVGEQAGDQEDLAGRPFVGPAGQVLRAVMGEAGHGVFELASDMTIPEDEFAWMAAFAKETGLPVNYSLLQSPFQPNKWRDMLALTAQAQAQGANIKAGIACRPTGMVLGWQSTVHPFIRKTAYRAIAALPFAERLERLRDPAVREAIITEERFTVRSSCAPSKPSANSRTMG